MLVCLSICLSLIAAITFGLFPRVTGLSEANKMQIVFRVNKTFLMKPSTRDGHVTASQNLISNVKNNVISKIQHVTIIFGGEVVVK